VLAVEIAIFELAYRAVGTLRLGPERALPDCRRMMMFLIIFIPMCTFLKILLQGHYTQKRN
jgi:hypothetical protein